LEKYIEKCIIECKLCGDLPKLSCNSMKFGKSKILVLGESPAKDGWIESGKAFYNKDGKLQASGRVLDRLLGLCGLSIDDINFTECCKCVISNRNLLRTCMQNSKSMVTIHSMPYTRLRLYVNNLISGLIIYLLPFRNGHELIPCPVHH